jgi:CBS domain-containing protein
MAKQVVDVMTRDVEIIGPNDSLKDAAEKMRTLNVGSLPICENDKPIGIITDRDIVIRAVSQGLDVNSTPVSQAMTGDVETVFQDEDLEVAMRTMREEQIRRILVVDRDGKLAGILALGDLAEELGSKEAGKTLEKISQPSQPASH